MSPRTKTPTLTKFNINELPKRERKSESNFEKLPNWPDMKAALDSGLAVAEALDMFVPDDIAPEYGLTHQRTGTRFLKKYVRDIGKRYTVKCARRGGGVHYQVSNPVVMTKRKRAAIA